MNTAARTIFISYSTSYAIQLTSSISSIENGTNILQIESNRVGTFTYSVSCLEQSVVKRSQEYTITIIAGMYFRCSIWFYHSLAVIDAFTSACTICMPGHECSTITGVCEGK